MEEAEFLHGGQHCRPGTPLCAAAGGDHFVVEDLLDFSNEEGEGGEWGLDSCAAGNSTESSTVTAVDCCSNSLSGCDPHFGCGDLALKGFADAGLSGDLCGPHEELAELEWLSNFVEESFSSEDLHLEPNLLCTTKPTVSTSFAAAKSELFVPAQPSLFRPEAIVPGKARSKRSRAAPCSWSSRLLLFSPSMATASYPESELISLPNAASPAKKATKLEKKPDLVPAPSPSEVRRCLHCQVEKTPQWRAGPMGPKTLCNACGVRYKSGRLVPEYRPAASPTFIPSKHSNSHRRVLELRRQQDLQRQQHQLRSEGAAEASGDGMLLRHMGPDFRHLM